MTELSGLQSCLVGRKKLATVGGDTVFLSVACVHALEQLFMLRSLGAPCS